VLDKSAPGIAASSRYRGIPTETSSSQRSGLFRITAYGRRARPVAGGSRGREPRAVYRRDTSGGGRAVGDGSKGVLEHELASGVGLQFT